MGHDYKKLGFKSGLEIHQQLDSSKKLFSNAPSFLRSDKGDYTVIRKLHAVPGEGGEVDVAVEHEALLGKEFEYEAYEDTTSLVELDEAPPERLNDEALEICLQIALLLNCSIYPVSQVMRKTVIDGSNTSGFQRTVLIGYDGFVETSFGKVGIESIALEEDSARVLERGKKRDLYRLDRLGIPLVEITTSPDMRNPEQVKECALKIGEILRACKVKRGIGTIRQDVNVSIKGHDRVEIKGFQDAKMFVKTIDKEIDRQLEDIKNQKEGKKIVGKIAKWTEGSVRNAKEDGSSEYLRPVPGKARMYPETDLELLKLGKAKLDKLRKNLPRLKSEIRDELKKKGLSDEIINLVLANGVYVDEFLALIKVYGKDANLVGKMVTLWRQELASKFKKDIKEIEDKLNESVLERILREVKKGKLTGSNVRKVFLDVMNGIEIEEALKQEEHDDHKLEDEVRKIVKEKPGLRENAYMGLVMKKFAGKIDAKRAMEIIKKVLEQGN